MRRGRTAAAAALLTASLVLTGCAGAADDTARDAKGGLSAQKPGYAGPEAASDGAADTASGAERTTAPKSKTPLAGPQHVIRTAELTVEVEDAAKATAAARRAAGNAGGHVENETTERVEDARVTSRLVLRVPQERYDAVLAELAGAGELVSRKADAKDVTEQVVDVESRIATQRASVVRVRALMEKATQLSDVVTLEGELSRRQADLESLLAQRSALKDRTSMATITLDLIEPEAAPAEEEDDRPGFLDALSGGWDALVAAAAWILIVLAALAPWLAVAAVAYVVWRRAVRPRLARRAKRERQPGPRTWTPAEERPVNAAGVPTKERPVDAARVPTEERPVDAAGVPTEDPAGARAGSAAGVPGRRADEGGGGESGGREDTA
ncbi:DUF4349 domain-containing protein [Streptomyces sp. NPDC051921]|uniref:DUF4349 domain-containing protein n=1 Tax=Streptomyces sp. NPDC051921 TaxID=3155806 RepID=UPI00344382CF